MSLFTNIDNQIDNIYDKRRYTEFFSESIPYFDFDTKIIKYQNGDYVCDLDELIILSKSTPWFFQFDMSLIRETSFTPIIKASGDKNVYVKNTVNEEDCQRLNKLFSIDKNFKRSINFLNGGIIKDLDFYVPYINICSDTRKDCKNNKIEYDCKIKPLIHVDKFDQIKEIKSSCNDFTIYLEDDQLINMILNSNEDIELNKIIPSNEYYDVVMNISSNKSIITSLGDYAYKMYMQKSNKFRKYLWQSMNFKSNIKYLNLIICPCYTHYDVFFRNKGDVIDSFCKSLKEISIIMKLDNNGHYDLINNNCKLKL